MDMDVFPMVYTDQASGLTFIWKGPKKTTIEITREEVHVNMDAAKEALRMGNAGANVFDAEGVITTDYITDQCIGVYDHATGRITLKPTWDAFVARVTWWLTDGEHDDLD